MTPRLRLLSAMTSVALIGAACGSGDDGADSASTVAAPATTAAPSTTAEPATTLPDDSEAGGGSTDDPTVEIDLTTCDNSAEDFSILCEAYTILTTEYVDELDDGALAAGASQGIEEFVADASTSGAGSPASFTCPIPSDEFALTCDAAAVALAGGSVEVESIAEAAVRGMFDFGLTDPNSVYYTQSVLSQIEEERTGTISGIGSLVQTEELVDGETTQCNVISSSCLMSVVGIIEGGPAEAAGLQAGDVMLTVDGESIEGWTVDEVVGRVRGEEGTAVRLRVDRAGQVLDFEIVRAPITVPVTESELLDGNIGYLKLSQFTANSPDLFRGDLQQLLDAGAESLVIDFQNNPGGALQAAVSIASEFLSDGLVLRTESPDNDREYEVIGDGLAIDRGVPVVVLVNAGSASASEVVAGVLQETGRATVIGTSTFGKNTVQQQFGLSNGGAIKVTIARWVTPSGLDFGADGILPDVVVEIPPGADPDFLLNEALDFLAA